MRFVHLEYDLYRPTHTFPLQPFQRLVLLARAVLSAAMMVCYSLQTGRARMGPSRCVRGGASCVVWSCNAVAWWELVLGAEPPNMRCCFSRFRSRCCRC